jgi:hypothetical protein
MLELDIPNLLMSGIEYHELFGTVGRRQYLIVLAF